MNKSLSALLSVGAVGAAGIVGAENGPQRPLTGLWYALLRKPRYTPPGPVVGVAWTALEGLLVAVGYRLLRAPDQAGRPAALGAWSATLLGLAGYPWLFFRERRLGPASLASGAMLASAVSLAAAARKVDRPSMVMTAPLVLWLGFATFLSEELWRRNRPLSR